MPKKRSDSNSIAGQRDLVLQVSRGPIQWPPTFRKADDEARQAAIEEVFAHVVQERAPDDWTGPDLHQAAELSHHLYWISEQMHLLAKTGPLVKNDNRMRVNPIYHAMQQHRCAVVQISRAIGLNIRSQTDPRSVKERAGAARSVASRLSEMDELLARPN